MEEYDGVLTYRRRGALVLVAEKELKLRAHASVMVLPCAAKDAIAAFPAEPRLFGRPMSSGSPGPGGNVGRASDMSFSEMRDESPQSTFRAELIDRN